MIWWNAAAAAWNNNTPPITHSFSKIVSPRKRHHHHHQQQQLKKERLVVGVATVTAVTTMMSCVACKCEAASSSDDGIILNNNNKNNKNNSSTNAIVAGAVAGAVARIFVAPLDVIKIRLQIQKENYSLTNAKYKGAVSAMATIAREEGIRKGFWAGTLPALCLWIRTRGFSLDVECIINIIKQQQQFFVWCRSWSDGDDCDVPVRYHSNAISVARDTKNV